MKTIKDKQILVAADIAGVALKNAIVDHLVGKGWTVTDIGVKTLDEENPEMFHRIGLKVGAKIAEGEFERAMIFCGTGMGIHIAASKCPHVHAAVVESPHAALRAITGNNVNVLAMAVTISVTIWVSRSPTSSLRTIWATDTSGGLISTSSTSSHTMSLRHLITRNSRLTALR